MHKIVVQVDADLEDLVPDYLRNRRNDLESILKALAGNDYETIRVLGHTMKGTGGGYGFDAITDHGRSLEQAAKDRDPVAIRRVVEELGQYLDAVEVVYQ
jgi:HPt (histidine-containing phosphotransfer) domain-containing protein